MKRFGIIRAILLLAVSGGALPPQSAVAQQLDTAKQFVLARQPVPGDQSIPVGEPMPAEQSAPARQSLPVQQAAGSPKKEILVRCDDIGMNHTVNMAFEKVAQSGIPVSASVMFACPWYQEAVEIIKRYPNVTVGVHLTMNSEWKNYRWGPVAGWKAVPTLTDSVGYFHPSSATFFEGKPSLAEVEMEIRAQLNRAIRSGLPITYVDTHMSSLSSTPEMIGLVRRVAREAGLGISRCFGEKDLGSYYAKSPESKLDTLLANIGSVAPGEVRLLVFHLGLQTPEMDALVDMNASGLPNMSRHREAELRALLSEEFRRGLADLDIRLINYRQLIERVGLQNSLCPETDR